MKPFGRFITFEGGEGVGKTTQAKLLAARIGDDTVCQYRKSTYPNIPPPGHPHVHTSEARRRALMYMLDRHVEIETVIGPLISRGVHVVYDRYMDSTEIYQGLDLLESEPDLLWFGKRTPHYNLANLRVFNRYMCEGYIPEITFLLDVCPTVALDRIAKRGNPSWEDSRPLILHEHIRARYLAQAARERRIKVIIGEGSEAEISERIWRQYNENK